MSNLTFTIHILTVLLTYACILTVLFNETLFLTVYLMHIVTLLSIRICIVKTLFHVIRNLTALYAMHIH